jgi:hypothetical protein
MGVNHVGSLLVVNIVECISKIPESNQTGLEKVEISIFSVTMTWKKCDVKM